jgi:phage host-nuclease inhibitor protein Gam
VNNLSASEASRARQSAVEQKPLCARPPNKPAAKAARSQTTVNNTNQKAKTSPLQKAGVFVYCQQHRSELFPEKKSIELLQASIGYRSGPPSVEKRSKQDTWSAIARRLEALPWGAAYLTTPEPEVDKKSLLADRERLNAGQLAAAGIRFKQDESFFITPKSGAAPTTRMEASQTVQFQRAR